MAFINLCYNKAKKESQRVYDREQRKNADFYSSKEWVRLTELCKNKFKGLDIYRLYKYRVYTSGELSHHVEELNDNKERALDIKNLIYLSDESHREIHTAYNKSKEDKRVMQEYLFEIIKQYEKEYM